ncbi:MAG: hypothetical protein ACREQ9_07850, partial [Candidatus Binatia bacterium]
MAANDERHTDQQGDEECDGTRAGHRDREEGIEVAEVERGDDLEDDHRRERGNRDGHEVALNQRMAEKAQEDTERREQHVAFHEPTRVSTFPTPPPRRIPSCSRPS